MITERSRRVGEFVLAVALVTPTLAFAQEPTNSGSTQDPSSANPPAESQVPTSQSSTTQSQPNPAAGTQGLFARALNSASPLARENGPLQWGWISVRSASFLQYYTDSESTLGIPGATPSNASLDVSQLSTSVVVNHSFGASRLTELTVQYTPSLFITEGHVYTNALNQSAGVDTTFQLNPRWSLQLSDRFNYYGRQRSFSGLSLDANYSLGTVEQNNFLDGPARVIYNAVGGTITYLWSPVTTVSFTPSLGYQDSTGALDTKQNISAWYVGGQVVISHAISATQTIGVSDTAQHASYSDTTTAGSGANGWQQDFLFTYGQQFGATWRLKLGLGLSSNTGGVSRSNLGANVGITKSFQRMDFALNYNRGHQFNGYITASSSDRVDLINTIRWSQRFSTSTSVAYFRTTGSPTPATSGEYATEQLSFALTRSLSLTGGYSYTKQTGDGVYILSGNRRFVTVGITWAPPPPIQY